MGKAQASIELTIIAFIMLMVLLVLFEFGQNKILENSSVLQVSQARNTVDLLAKAAIEVHNEGVGASRKLYITIPDNVNSSRVLIGNNSITIGVYVSNGMTDVISQVSFTVVKGGFFPTTPGSYWVWVISKETYVQIGSSLDVQPLNINLELFPNNSTSTNLTFTNYGNSSVNVSLALTWADSETSVTLNGTASPSFAVLPGTSNAQIINLTANASSNASRGVRNGYVSVSTNISETNSIPVIVNVVSLPVASGVAYLTMDTYNDSAYLYSNSLFLRKQVVYYAVKSYNSSDNLTNSTVTVRAYSPSSILMSENTYSPNSGTGVYQGSYTLPSNASYGSWKLVAYEVGGVSTAMYFTVLPIPIWLDGWQYRKAHNITGTTADAQTNYQIRFTVFNTTGTDSGENVYLGSNARSDFGDVRFTNGTQSLLNYWIENTSTNYATFWVQIDGNLTSKNQTIYIYYGNSTATNTSNGTNTFLFFDDFNGASFDTNKWTNASAGSAKCIQSSGLLNLTGDNSNNRASVKSVNQTAYNVAIRLSAKQVTQGSSGVDYSIDSDGSSGYANGLTSNGYTGENFNSAQLNLWKTVSVSQKWIQQPSISPSAGVFHTYELANYNKALTHWLDGAQKTSYTDTDSTTFSTYYIQLYSREDPYETDFDWILVRKYASPEPSHGSWGSEESAS